MTETEREVAERIGAEHKGGVLGAIAFMAMLFAGYAALKPTSPPQAVVQYVPAPTATPAPITVAR